MSDTSSTPTDSKAEQEHVVETGELILPPEQSDAEEDRSHREAIEEPAKVMRVGAMLRQLLDELHKSTLDEQSRDRLRDIYETSIAELGSALSPDLREELGRLTLPFADEEIPSEAELRVVKAQLVGWLEGLIQGIQATLFAQQMAAQQQLANMRGQLPPGQRPPQERPAPSGSTPHGTYL